MQVAYIFHSLLLQDLGLTDGFCELDSTFGKEMADGMASVWTSISNSHVGDSQLPSFFFRESLATTLNPESKSILIPKTFLVEFEMTYFKK